MEYIRKNYGIYVAKPMGYMGLRLKFILWDIIGKNYGIYLPNFWNIFGNTMAYIGQKLWDILG